MIVNSNIQQQTNMSLAMEHARRQGIQRDIERNQYLKETTLHFSTEDEDAVAEQYAGANTADFTHNGQIGVHEDGTPIMGETRIYIVKNDQEKDMKQTQSAVAAAAEAAASSGQCSEAEVISAENLFEEKKPVEKPAKTTLQQEPKPLEQAAEKEKFSFKSSFKKTGEKLKAFKNKFNKPKVDIDQEATFEMVKSQLTLVELYVKSAMNHLPVAKFTPL